MIAPERAPGRSTDAEKRADSFGLGAAVGESQPQHLVYYLGVVDQRAEERGEEFGRRQVAATRVEDDLDPLVNPLVLGRSRNLRSPLRHVGPLRFKQDRDDAVRIDDRAPDLQPAV